MDRVRAQTCTDSSSASSLVYKGRAVLTNRVSVSRLSSIRAVLTASQFAKVAKASLACSSRAKWMMDRLGGRSDAAENEKSGWNSCSYARVTDAGVARARRLGPRRRFARRPACL